MKTFKAPQKPLKSSWVQIAYSKPKSTNIIKRSLSSRANAISKYRGDMVTTSSFLHSNLY